MIDGGNTCPVCGANQMPPWSGHAQESARACQQCGFIEVNPGAAWVPPPS